jgi:xanthine dehydrogenase small subunit
MALTLLRFDSPQSALSALQDAGAQYLGGGSLLMRMINTADTGINSLVRLDTLQQRSLEVTAAFVRLGAAVRMSQIIRTGALSYLIPVAASIGGPAVQSIATVGGNLHAPSPYGDLATALVALDAEVHLITEAGLKAVPVTDFLRQRDSLQSKTILESVTFKSPGAGTFLFRKVRRTHPRGSSLLTIAAIIEQSGGLVTKARIALGTMAPTAIRALAAERALLGCPLSAQAIAPALAAALEGTSPVDDSIASAWYRRTVLPVHLRRLLVAEETTA